MPVTGLPFVLVSSAVQTQAGRGFSAVPTGQVHTLPASLAVYNGVLVLRHCNYRGSITPERPNARVRRGQIWVKIHIVRMGLGPSALSNLRSNSGRSGCAACPCISAGFNLTSETYLRRGLYLPALVPSGSTEEPDLRPLLR